MMKKCIKLPFEINQEISFLHIPCLKSSVAAIVSVFMPILTSFRESKINYTEISILCYFFFLFFFLSGECLNDVNP